MTTDDEIAVFSWIVYRDGNSCDVVNAGVMADSRPNSSDIPLDGGRMIEAASRCCCGRAS